MKTMIKLGLAIMLFMTTAISNHAQAQTKEETIDWLNTNGRILFNSSTEINEKEYTYSFDRIENGNAIFKSSWGGENTETIIPVTSILYQDVNTLSTIKKDYVDAIWININLNGSEIKRNGKIIESTNINSKLFQVFVKNEDLENVKRVLKAIMHLAKLSGAKENKQLF